MMTHHDLVDPDLADARHHRRETAALAVLLLALMVCLAYIVGGSYPESLTACTPPPAVTTPHQVAPGAGAPPSSPSPGVELGGTNECEAP